MSVQETQQIVRVDKNHRAVLLLPDLAEGTELQVTIRQVSLGIQRRPGSAAGLFKMRDDFDEPLEDFA